MEEYRRWEDNIKMDLKEISVDVMNGIEQVTVDVEYNLYVLFISYCKHRTAEQELKRLP